MGAILVMAHGANNDMESPLIAGLRGAWPAPVW